MANISGSEAKTVLQIRSWLGLNESPDGDTGLKPGQAAEMRNFRVTREGHLQIRPGYGSVCTLVADEEGVGGAVVHHPVRRLWYGYVAGVRHLLCACGGRLWDVDPDTWAKTDLGAIDDAPTTIFGYAKNVYILTGSGYYRWTGSGSVETVEGYVPLVAVATPPAGGGTLLEGVNKLTGKRRQRFSPDGTSTVFQLTEVGIDEVIGVEGTSETYTADLAAGTVTFSSAPAKGTDCLTITYRKGTGEREKVTGMRFAETFGGSETRVFLYGDGSNEAIYSGLDDQGANTAEYFPDLNVVAIGTANTPVTALIRHYDRMLCFKPDGAWSMEYSPITLASGETAAAFYVSAINREVGNEAPGQAQLVDNDPRTLFGRAVYAWPLSNSAIRDERNAKRLSDRVNATLGAFDLSSCITFDDNDEQEYYIICGDRAVVHNYAADAWYYYTDVPMECLVKVGGVLYFGTPDGRIMEFSRSYRNSDGREIDAYWESGSMDFDREWMRKYSSLIWVSLKPEAQAAVYLTAQTDRKSDYTTKIAAPGLATFFHASFEHWSFQTNRKPKIVRAKIKVKKAVFYKLILSSCSKSATATVLSVDIQVRYTGNAK